MKSLILFLIALLPVTPDNGITVEPTIDPAPEAAIEIVHEHEAASEDAHEDCSHAAHQADVDGAKSAPAPAGYWMWWTHGCGYTDYYWVYPGRTNWFTCWGCGWYFYICG